MLPSPGWQNPAGFLAQRRSREYLDGMRRDEMRLEMGGAFSKALDKKFAPFAWPGFL